MVTAINVEGVSCCVGLMEAALYQCCRCTVTVTNVEKVNAYSVELMEAFPYSMLQMHGDRDQCKKGQPLHRVPGMQIVDKSCIGSTDWVVGCRQKTCDGEPVLIGELVRDKSVIVRGCLVQREERHAGTGHSKAQRNRHSRLTCSSDGAPVYGASLQEKHRLKFCASTLCHIVYVCVCVCARVCVCVCVCVALPHTHKSSKQDIHGRKMHTTL